MQQLARLCRPLLSRPGTSADPIAISRRLLSAGKPECSEDEAQSVYTRDIDFAKRLKELQPSETFKRSLSGLEAKQLDKVLPELELFVYMGTKIPVSLSDEEWRTLLACNNVAKRVAYLEFAAVRQWRKNFVDTKASSEEAAYRAHLDEQTRIHEAGGMGYGSGLNELMMNPFRNRKRHNWVEGSRIWTSMRLNYPQVIFDMQVMPKEETKDLHTLSKQLSYIITANFHARDPLPLSFANVSKNPEHRQFLQKTIGFYTGQYTHQTILPDFTTQGVRDVCSGDKEILYITRYARDVLDGPLTADAYVLCASTDRDRQSLGAARKAKLRPVRLPISRYVRWLSGPQILPFPNIVNILREVRSNGGDWRTALHNNISKRHLMSPEERDSKGMTARSKLKVLERKELVKAIIDATGNK